jgi:EAL domain-containing protein (putative c-di-GMP-specific phosphodiesterase class I)
MSIEKHPAYSLQDSPLPHHLRHGLRQFFQPILRLGTTPQLFALECLTRGPEGTGWEEAPALFHWVRATSRERSMDRVCLRAGMAEAAGLPGAPDISLNVHLSTLADREFVAEVLGETEAPSIPPSRLILEIVDSPPALDALGTRRHIEKLRHHGVRIALDDFGLGHSNFHRLVTVRPDLVKVHTFFIAGCEIDSDRLRVLDSLSRLAGQLGFEVMVKGVESPAEEHAVRGLGIELAQGFLWARPSAGHRLRDCAAPLSPGALWRQCAAAKAS